MSLVMSGAKNSVGGLGDNKGDAQILEGQRPEAEQADAADGINLPRSASYTYFPQVKDHIFDDPTVVELKGTISEEELAAAEVTQDNEFTASGGTTPDEELKGLDDSTETPGTVPAQRPLRKAVSKLFHSEQSKRKGENGPEDEKAQTPTRRETRSGKSPSRSLSMLRRKSWISSSPRSTSPVKSGAKEGDKDSSTPVTGWLGRRKSIVSRSPEKQNGSIERGEGISGSSKKGAVLQKRSRRPSAPTNSPGGDVNLLALDIPAVPPLPKSCSTDRLPASPDIFVPGERVPPIPPKYSLDKLKLGKNEMPKKKDELWSVFRSLDSEFHKFQSKPTALKVNIIRISLQPFLKTYSSHPSTYRLRPEELDKRVNVLNKWWTGLLELLHNTNNQSISGTDRIPVLEGITGIMERPEWRLSPSPFCPLAERSTVSVASRAASSTSLSSSASEFLAESVHHNVRNIFVRNILAQMGFVLDKMSLRNTPASVVIFCGKTCAYAFLFCPGVADMLIRLWNPSLDNMKRVVEECQKGSQNGFEETSKRILSAFPPAVQSLPFTSPLRTFRDLRKPSMLPLGTANFDWYGNWVKRWSGTESDLFYYFVKHYHNLISDFLPPGPSVEEKLCAPGFVLVHAQILTNLDATIHRNNGSLQEDPVSGASAITFDDVLDASATTLPVAPPNAARSMAENRLIMLIREFLSERSSISRAARRIFADTFGSVLRACARRISIYDHNACYTLCDFLEEAMVIIVRFEQHDVTDQSILDWTFWLSVFRHMVQSENTTTEIRLYAFLYSIWGTVAGDSSRKIDLCLNFLLDPVFFEARFNHWCPMVRSYYMRLLCWRVGRYDGEESEDQDLILKTLLERLRSVWSYYLYQKETAAQAENKLPPSTTPSNPAPGRRLLIIRTDSPISTPTGALLSLDGIMPSSSASQVPSLTRLSSFNPLTDLNERPMSSTSDSSDYDTSEDSGKGAFGLIRNLLSSARSRSKSRNAEARVSQSKTQKAGGGESDAVSSKNGQTQPDNEPPPSFRKYCFKFSLEWIDRRLQLPSNVRLHSPRLPSPAQQHVQSLFQLPEVRSVKPAGRAAMSSRYAGRALAEWTIIVNEYQNFFERRKQEGVPSNKWVETPTLGVEAFRRPG